MNKYTCETCVIFSLTWQQGQACAIVPLATWCVAVQNNANRVARVCSSSSNHYPNTLALKGERLASHETPRACAGARAAFTMCKPISCCGVTSSVPGTSAATDGSALRHSCAKCYEDICTSSRLPLLSASCVSCCIGELACDKVHVASKAANGFCRASDMAPCSGHAWCYLSASSCSWKPDALANSGTQRGPWCFRHICFYGHFQGGRQRFDQRTFGEKFGRRIYM